MLILPETATLLTSALEVPTPAMKRLLPPLMLTAAMSTAATFPPINLSAAATSAPSPLTTPTYFGINGIGYFHRANLPDELRQREELIRDLGVKWDRSDFWWADLERQPGKWNYDKADAAVDLYESAGLQMLPILCYGARWRDTQGPATPEQLEEWGRYVDNVVSRYAGRLDTWEVWNEPNIIPFWRPQPNADAYAALLQLTAQRARAANPQASLVGLTLADLDHDFLNRVLQVAGTHCFDRISYHYYRIGPPEERTPDEVAELQLTLRHYGKECPIWVTEMGVTSYAGTEGVSEHLQAIYLVRQILLLIGSGVERVFPFCLVDNVTDPGGPWGSQLGMVALDGRKKPAFYAYKIMISELQDYRLVGPVSLGEGIRALLFQHDATEDQDQHKLVAWTIGDVKDIRIAVDHAVTSESASGQRKAATVVPAHLHKYRSMLGANPPVEFDGATQRVMLSPAVTYLPVDNEHLLRDAQTRFEPSALAVSPGQYFALPPLRTHLADVVTSSIHAPERVLQQTPEGKYQVRADAPLGWHSVRATLATTSGTVEKELRLWVRPELAVEVRPFGTSATPDLLTSFSITNNNLQGSRAYRFIAEPQLPGIELPGGSIGRADRTNWSGSPDGIGPYLQRQSVPISKAALQSLSTNLTLFLESDNGTGTTSEPAYRIAILPQLASAPQIDGELTEFAAVAATSLDDERQLLTAEWRDSRFNPSDCSAQVRTVWVPGGLAIAADIRDDHPQMNPMAAGPNIYKGDGIELYIGTRGYQGEHYSNQGNGYFHFALSPGRGGDGATVSDFSGEVAGAQIATRLSDGGYTIEAFIPASALDNYTPALGDVLAWDVQLNDRDTYAENAKQKALMWNGNHLNWLRATKWGMAVVK